ncbi:MAG: hypothetical protein MJ186_02600 [Clostridia bacterium]|nr:hypothetical protein [Clostridia bacterium]
MENMIELFKDWGHENSGYWEAEIDIIPGDENDVYFYAMQKIPHAGTDRSGFREEIESYGSRFRIAEFLEKLEEELASNNGSRYVSVGNYYNDVPYVSFRIEDGWITQMTVRKVSVEVEIEAEKLFGKIRSYK